MSTAEHSQDNITAGSIADSSHGLMPSMGSSKMPKRPAKVVLANPNYNKTDKLMQDMGTKDSIVAGWEIDPVRMAIIDSGCSSDTRSIDLAQPAPS